MSNTIPNLEKLKNVEAIFKEWMYSGATFYKFNVLNKKKIITQHPELVFQKSSN